MPISKNPTVIVNNFVTQSTTTDHGLLTGLGDDDHPQYLLTSSFLAISSGIANEINDLQAHEYWKSTTADIIFATGSIQVTGSALIKSGITGALNFLPDGTSFLVGAGGLTTSTASNGQITVNATALSTSVATDINALRTADTALSNSVAADILEFRWIGNTLDSTGDRTLSAADNNKVIYMSGSSRNILRVPPTLKDGFHVIAHQASAFNIQVVTTNSLFWPSTTYKSRSLEYGASIALHSGSYGIILGGILERV